MNPEDRTRTSLQIVKNSRELDLEVLSAALLKEVARIRDVLMPTYQSMGPTGSFVLAMMRADLDRAAEAMIVGDPVAMHRVYELLRGYKE